MVGRFCARAYPPPPNSLSSAHSTRPKFILTTASRGLIYFSTLPPTPFWERVRAFRVHCQCLGVVAGGGGENQQNEPVVVIDFFKYLSRRFDSLQVLTIYS